MEEEKIKTSVIIPVYNTKEYLEQCVESVLAQTQKEIEIILVDDGSTDGSNRIIQKYEKKYPFVKAIYQENQKLGAARNAGVKAASGKYVYFLDSDDYIREDLIEESFFLAEKEHLDFVMFDAQTFIEGTDVEFRTDSTKESFDRSHIGISEKVYSGVEFWNRYFYQGGVFSCAYLVYINTEFIRENSLYFEAGIYYEDMDWIVRMHSRAEKILYISKQFYYRRFRADSIMTSKYNDIHLKSCIYLCKKLINMDTNIQDTAVQSMTESILLVMLEKFNEIFEIYCREARLEDVWPEIFGFYQFMLTDIEIEIKNMKVQRCIFSIADRVILESRKYDRMIDGTDLILEEYKKRLVLREIGCFPLNNKENVIGIYGTGLISDRFLDLYEEYIGEISAPVFFIDTYKQSGESYRGYSLYNIKDITEIDIDIIIIASSRYEEEMRSNILECRLGRTEILTVPRSVSILAQLCNGKKKGKCSSGERIMYGIRI